MYINRILYIYIPLLVLLLYFQEVFPKCFIKDREQYTCLHIPQGLKCLITSFFLFLKYLRSPFSSVITSTPFKEVPESHLTKISDVSVGLQVGIYGILILPDIRQTILPDLGYHAEYVA